MELPTNWIEAQRCIFGPEDGWRIELHDLSRDGEGVKACARLVHLRADGSQLARFLGQPMNVASCHGQECWADSCETFALDYRENLRVHSLYDWDDDGQSEAAVAAWVELARGRSVSRMLIVDDSGKGLRHLPATLSLTVADVEDVDGDSRPDFLLRYSSGVQTDEFGIVSADSLELVAHSLPQGKISVTDEQARAYAKSRCPEAAPSRIADEVSLLCAKLRGTPRDVALDAFRANCKGEQLNGCSTDPESTWDSFRPPFAL